MQKSIYLLLASVVLALASCTSDLVPNDFPLGDFYSYAPYKLNQTIYFTNNQDTIPYYTVFSVSEDYRVGSKRKGFKEIANKKVSLRKIDSMEEGVDLSIVCNNRAHFEVSLRSIEEPYSIDALYEVDFTNEDIWSKSFKNSKILRYFSNVITLSQDGKPSAQVEKVNGLTKFTDESGRIWSVVK